MTAPGLTGPEGHDGRDPDRDLAEAWLAQGRPAWVVQVAEARGSVPRGAGTCMLVSAGDVRGTIGGGHLEWQAIERALAHLASGRHEPEQWRVSLGPSLGQCCGGAVTLQLSPLSARLLATWRTPAPRFRLRLFGAGHVGRALVQVLASLPCEVWWVDQREAAFPGPLPDGPGRIHPVWSDPAVAEVAHGQPGDAWLVLTHSHALDFDLVEAILQRQDAGWCGLIGSATKRARFESRLRARGWPSDAMASWHCPVGLPGIEGKEPAVLAVAVAADLLFSHKQSRFPS